HRLADELGRRETEFMNDVPVDEHDVLAHVDDDDRLGHRFESCEQGVARAATGSRRRAGTKPVARVPHNLMRTPRNVRAEPTRRPPPQRCGSPQVPYKAAAGGTSLAGANNVTWVTITARAQQAGPLT